MKRVFTLAVLITLTVCLLSYPVAVQGQPGGPPSQGDNRAGWYCPNRGSYMGPGYGMGPGMMWGYGGGPGHGYGQYRQPLKPLEEKDAKAEVEDYLKANGNPNLKMGKVKDSGNTFDVEILSKNNSLVDKILVDKNTGWMRSEY